MRDELTTESLRSKFSGVSDGLPSGLRLRLHRSLSWIERAEKEAEDIDATFIFYWIAFNAAYAKDIPESYGAEERELFGEYFEKIVRFDANRTIYDAIWSTFSGPIRLLLNNRYVFQPFWRHHNQMPGYGNWENFFIRDQKLIGRALARQDTTGRSEYSVRPALRSEESTFSWRSDLEQRGESASGPGRSEHHGLSRSAFH